MIKRTLFDVITKRLGKAIILLGPRQTGKSTLLNAIAKNIGDYMLLDADDPFVRAKLENANTLEIQQLIGKYKLVFVDEAQRIKNIGLTLKIITDHFQDVQLLVSGSSALELSNSINEPLTGRKWEYMLYPISWEELSEHAGYLKSQQQLENRLIFGMYPEVINEVGNERDVLKQLSSSYLYKDLLSYHGIRKPEVLEKLLQALALQVGSEVSYNELALILKIDSKTVVNYIDLLEKAFIVFRLSPFNRNLRSEINTNRKIYFYDNGIRNSLISNYNPLSMRQDVGHLWENFLISERMKYNHYHQHYANRFFWRNKQQQEIDYVEERDGKLYAYEIKWNSNKKVNFPKSFLEKYENVETKVITRDNFIEFVGG